MEQTIRSLIDATPEYISGHQKQALEIFIRRIPYLSPDEVGKIHDFLMNETLMNFQTGASIIQNFYLGIYGRRSDAALWINDRQGYESYLYCSDDPIQAISHSQREFDEAWLELCSLGIEKNWDSELRKYGSQLQEVFGESNKTRLVSQFAVMTIFFVELPIFDSNIFESLEWVWNKCVPGLAGFSYEEKPLNLIFASDEERGVTTLLSKPWPLWWFPEGDSAL